MFLTFVSISSFIEAMNASSLPPPSSSSSSSPQKRWNEEKRSDEEKRWNEEKKLSVAELLAGVERLFVGKTPATMPSMSFCLFLLLFLLMFLL